MGQNIQCPRCRRHTHEEARLQDPITKKYWIVDRCADVACHYNFELTECATREAKPETDKDSGPESPARKPKRGWRI